MGIQDKDDKSRRVKGVGDCPMSGFEFCRRQNSPRRSKRPRMSERTIFHSFSIKSGISQICVYRLNG